MTADAAVAILVIEAADRQSAAEGDMIELETNRLEAPVVELAVRDETGVGRLNRGRRAHGRWGKGSRRRS